MRRLTEVESMFDRISQYVKMINVIINFFLSRPLPLQPFLIKFVLLAIS